VSHAGPVIVPLVEGHGEVEAADLLLRRIIHREGRFDVYVAGPFRVKRNRIVKEAELERSLALAVRKRAAAAALVLLDADDDCPVELGQKLRTRALASSPVPVAVVCASREFEAWFLAAKRSLRGLCEIKPDAECVSDAEGIRDAKGRLTANMLGDRRYLEAADQPTLADGLDFDLAEANARSFRKLCDEVRGVLAGL